MKKHIMSHEGLIQVVATVASMKEELTGLTMDKAVARVQHKHSDATADKIKQIFRELGIETKRKVKTNNQGRDRVRELARCQLIILPMLAKVVTVVSELSDRPDLEVDMTRMLARFEETLKSMANSSCLVPSKSLEEVSNAASQNEG